MKPKYIILIVVLVAVVIGSWYAYNEYNRTNKDLKDVKPDFTTDVSSLLMEFEKDTATANRKYIDKVILVNGQVKSIDREGNPVVIAIGDPTAMSSVQCSMDSTYVEDYKDVNEGDHVKIKGMCTGGKTEELFGTDVILNRCVIENN